MPILSSVLKKVLRLSTLPALMSSRTLCHLKVLQFLRQFGQRFGDGLGGGGAFVAEKIAVAQPDDLAGAEKGQGLQGFAQPGQGRRAPRRCWTRWLR